jgi:Phage tail tube protein, GTA-gp10
MAINGEVTLTWGDGEHKFNVAKIKAVLELEEKCNAGIAEIFRRISDGKWRINDVRETLRIGLIGGGMPPDKAMRLINRYCDDRPWTESLQPAMVVLMAAMVGVPGDDVGKKATTERAKENQPSQTMADMSVPSSMESEPQSDSLHAIPTK